MGLHYLVLRLSLAAHGYEVIEAATGQEGLAHVAAHRPDLVLLDLGLPDGDGLTLLPRLRGQPHGAIVVMSMRDQVSYKLAALDAGADDYLIKPLTAREVLERLRLAQRRAQR